MGEGGEEVGQGGGKWGVAVVWAHRVLLEAQVVHATAKRIHDIVWVELLGQEGMCGLLQE